MRVAIWPGQTALKRAAWPNSSASDAVSAISAALLAAYGARPSSPTFPATDAIATTEPPLAISPSSASRVISYTGRAFTANTSSVGEIAGRERDPAGLPRRVDERRKMAIAERHRAVHDLRRSRRLRDIRRHELRRRDGARDGVAGRPIAAAEDNRYPSAASRSTQARPIPCVPPVTSAVAAAVIP